MSASSPAVAPALVRALAFFRASDAVRIGSDPQLPADLRPILRIAASEAQAIAAAARTTGEHPLVLREAAVLYLQRTLFDPAADSYRVLGVNRDADDARIKEHYRLLLRWLHPDRNADAWEAQLAYRLTAAWQDLRTPMRRSEYDAAHPGFESLDGEYLRTDSGWLRVVPQADLRPANERFLSARTMRLLPPLVLAALALLALLAVWLTHLQQPPIAVRSIAAAPLPEFANSSDRTLPRRLLDVEVADIDPLPLTPPEQAEPVVSAPAAPLPASPAPSAAQPAGTQTRPASSGRFRPVAAVVAPTEPVSASTLPTAVAARMQARPRLPAPSRARPAVDAAGATDGAVSASPPTVAARAEPAAMAVAAPPVPQAPDADDEREARLLLSRFILAYEAGDIAELATVFSSDAQNERGGREQMLREYRRLFRSSRERSMKVQRVNWLLDAGRLAVVASFHARISPLSGDDARELDGDIRFDLKREDGELRIHRLRHQSASG